MVCIEHIEVYPSPGLKVSSLTLQGFVSKEEYERHMDALQQTCAAESLDSSILMRINTEEKT
jgi:hypothetical protein